MALITGILPASDRAASYFSPGIDVFSPGVTHMSDCRRGNILIDRDVQGALMFRVGSYWLFCLLGVSLMILCWTAVSEPPRPIGELFRDLSSRYAPALVASLILLPLVMIDVTRVSHRFVGPMLRLRGALRQLAAGEHVHPIKFRDNDFWLELAEDFNRVAERAESLHQEMHKDSGDESELVAAK